MSKRREEGDSKERKGHSGGNRNGGRGRGRRGRGGRSNHDGPRRNPLYDSSALSIVTFNLLAPPYNKLKDKSPSSERHHQEHYWSRNNCILQMLKSKPLFADVLCLQEMWFTTEFLEGYDSVLHETHRSSKFKRQKKPDGLATYVRKCRHLELVRVWKISFTDVSCQNALMTELHHNGRPLIVVNCHLTYPHDAYHDRLRVLQAHVIARLIHKYLLAHISRDTMGDDDFVPVFITGDFNGPSSDAVYQFFQSLGYTSAYAAANGTEARVTQLTREETQVASDYTFFRTFSAAEMQNEPEIPELPSFDLEAAQLAHLERMKARKGDDAEGDDGGDGDGDGDGDADGQEKAGDEANASATSSASDAPTAEEAAVDTPPTQREEAPLRSSDGGRVCSRFLHSTCDKKDCSFAHALPPLPDTAKWQSHVRVKDEDRSRFRRRDGQPGGKKQKTEEEKEADAHFKTLGVRFSHLYPQSCDDAAWPSEDDYDVSDHRPVVSSFACS